MNKTPLIHFITNYVTMNDVANITLAFGGKPIMAEAPEEIKEITSISDCLVLNLGTITKQRFDIMIMAAVTANKKNIPIILDPVGVSASVFRKNIALYLLKNYKIDIIKGNLSEIKALLGLHTKSIGVDSIDIQNSHTPLIAHKMAKKYNTVTAITGKKDIISNGEKETIISGGSYMLTKITGTGCMASAIIAVLLAKSNNPFYSASYGITIMNNCGEYVQNSLNSNDGLGTFKIKLLDKISTFKKG